MSNTNLRKTLNLEEKRIKINREISSFGAGYMQGMCRVPPGFNIFIKDWCFFREKYDKM